MEKPEKYISVSEYHYEVCSSFLNEFASQFQWKPDGTDSLIDIGCGPGDLTVKIIEPFLPINYERLVGLDFSKEMIDYAMNNFKKEKIEFIQCDIEQKFDDAKLKQLGQFDHAITVKTLMWLADLEFAFRNIYKLLKPGGDFAFSYFYDTQISHLFLIMSEKEKWRKYYKNVSKGRMLLTANLSECLNYLKLAGFKPVSYRMKKLDSEYPIELFEGLILSLDPIINKLPKNLQKEYLAEMTKTLLKMNKDKFPNLAKNCIVVSTYEIMGYAKK